MNKADEWIQNFKNVNYEKYIVVADRAYYSFNFIKQLIDNKIDFVILYYLKFMKVIRIKNNINENCKKNLIKKYVLDNCKIVKNISVIYKKVYSKEHDKHVIIKCTNEYKYITNLKQYTDVDISEIYKKKGGILKFFLNCLKVILSLEILEKLKR